jgi:hypothetical protein
VTERGIMADVTPWTFGWTQLLTVAGLGLTGYIGFQGLRTFDRWQREKIEERRIDLALEALSLAYESKAIFGHIRSRVMYRGEGDDVPPQAGESDDHKRQRQSFFAVLQRIESSNDYFARVWKLQPKFIAIFGEKTEDIFDQLHKARRDIEATASTMVFEDEPFDLKDPAYKEELKGCRTTIFGSSLKGALDPVGQRLDDFRKRIDELCRPVIDRTYKSTGTRWWELWK